MSHIELAKKIALETTIIVILVVIFIMGMFYWLTHKTTTENYKVVVVNCSMAIVAPIDEHIIEDHLVVRNPWPELEEGDVVRLGAVGIQDIPYVAEVVTKAP